MSTHEATEPRARPKDGQYEPRGIRLSPALWEAIAREAEALQMSISEVLRRRLGYIFRVDADVQKSTAKSVEMPRLTLKEVPDDDD